MENRKPGGTSVICCKSDLSICKDRKKENRSSHSTPLPTEDRLQHATLWPEMKKLYGHAYEVYCLAAHPQLMLVASACVAAKPQHAFIILWNGYTDWTIHARLTHHQLTVTQLIWSPGGRYLLAVSRDRTWSVWRGVEQKIGENVACPIAPPIYNLFAYPTKGKGHSRIIWTGAWSSDERYFFTGSRDKSILAWNISETDATVPISCVPLEARHTCPEAVTALDVVGLTPTNGQWEYLMAVGLESGQLQLLLLHAINPDQSSSLTRILWSQPILFSPELCHVKNKRVRRVAFEPLIQSNQRTLSSAADDGLVRLFSINIEQLQNNML